MPASEFAVRSNGTIDISINGIRITGIFPYIDEKALAAHSITVSADSVRYEAEAGVVTLRVSSSDGLIVLSTEIEGCSNAHDIEPAGMAVIEGAEKVYIQGFGMGGPSGIFRAGDGEHVSHGIIGLGGRSGEGAAAVYTADHTRFGSVYRVSSCPSMFRDGWSPEDPSLGRCSCLFSAGFNLEGTASGRTVLPDIYFAGGDDLASCMHDAAERIAARAHARIHDKSTYHWCSWYYYYENFSQGHLEDLLRGLEGNDTGFRHIQVDAGYTDHIGDWLIFNHRYPGGLRQASESITEAGYEAGIWIAPFMIGDMSQTYRDHPDWIVRNRDGSPRTVFTSYTEPKLWGNTDNDYYILDVTHPGAAEYLREVFRTYRGYGFTLFKTDFIMWGMADSSLVSRYDDSLTSVEVLRMAFKIIREEIGEESYLLASIAPFMPLVGIADGMRIAGDIGAKWDGPYGPANLLHELPYDNYFNNIFWQNDPDAVILRDFATHLTDDETMSLALLQALSGGIVTTSDPVHELAQSRRDLLDFIRPDEAVRAGFPYLADEREEIVITHTLHDWNLLYALNPSDHPISVHYDLAEIFGTRALFQYRLSREDDDVIMPGRGSFFSGVLAPHESVLLFITEEPLTVKPTDLWHRTQVNSR